MALSIVVVTFLGLHLLAIGFPGALWGADSLAYYPAWAARVAAALTVPLLFPAVRARLVTLFSPRRSGRSAGSGRNPATTSDCGVSARPSAVRISIVRVSGSTSQTSASKR